MSSLDSEYIYKLKSSVDLCEIIGKSVTLRPITNDESVACCPFHSEKTASFRVNKFRFHCFGCGKRGDIFTWLQETEGLTFAQAVKRIGGDLNAVGSFTERERKEEIPIGAYYAPEALAIIDTNGLVYNKFFEHFPDEEAVRYICSRFSTDAIKKFGLVYAGPRYEVSKDPSTIERLSLAGLIGQNNDGSYYPRFRDRVIFPLKNSAGYTLGFAGRIIPRPENEALPKYTNPPTTKAFSKKTYMYGWETLERKDGRVPFIILVEGLIDVISMWSAGFRNVLSIMGTALTREHVNHLECLTDTVILCLDGDRPGEQAAIKASKQLINSPLRTILLSLPFTKDPDDICRNLPQAVDAKELFNSYPKVLINNLFKEELTMRLTKDDFDFTKFNEVLHPYVMANIQEGYPHYNVVDFVTKAWPEFADAINQATRTMVNDTILLANGKRGFKDEHLKSFIKAWRKPCAAVRKRNGQNK